MQVALEGAFPADRLRFPAGFNGALIDTLRHLMQPAAHAPSEVPDEQFFVGCSQFTDRVDAQAVEPLAGLGANAVDFPGRQRPDTARHVGHVQQGNAVRLVEIGADLRQQLVRGDADRAGQAGGLENGLLDAPGQRQTVFGKVGKIDVDLVDAPVFDQRGDAGHGGLEAPGVVAIGLEIGRQQDGIGGQLCRFHQAHAGKDAERAGFISRGGNDATPDIVAQAGKALAAVGLADRPMHAAPANHHGLAAQFRVVQQLDRGKEGIHVEVGDTPATRLPGRYRPHARGGRRRRPSEG